MSIKPPQNDPLPDHAEPSAPAGKMRAGGGLLPNLKLYMSRQAESPLHYAWEQTILAAAGWVPAIAGVALRSIAYKSILVWTAWPQSRPACG